MEHCRSIFSGLGIVAVIFGVPVVVTLLAGQLGYSAFTVGWTTLAAMMVLAFQSRSVIGRLCLGRKKLAPVRARRGTGRR